MSVKIEIKAIKQSDLDEVAKIHISAFPDSLITKFGFEAVKKYYEWQFESPDEMYGFGAYVDGIMVGICFGGLTSMVLGGFLRKNRWLIIKRFLLKPWLLFDSELFPKLLRGFVLLVRFSLKRNVLKTKPNIKPDQKFGLMSTATLPTARKIGVGKALTRHFEQFARELNFKEMFLSINPKNANSIGMHEHIGWVKDGDLENWKGMMRRDLTND